MVVIGGCSCRACSAGWERAKQTSQLLCSSVMNLQCLNVVAELALPAGRGEVNFAATL